MIKPNLSAILPPRLTRRALLKGSLIAGAGLAFAPWIGETTKAASPTLRKYVSPLAVPAVAQPTHIEDRVAQYSIEMTEFRRNVHPDLPPTTLWGYDGTWPGPTFETRTGRPIRVQWVNNLPGRHLLD